MDIKRIKVDTADISQAAETLLAGDMILLSGTVFTARDAAHKRLCALMDEGFPLPFSLPGATIYYAGPTPTPPHLPIGSCGPTTSCRMDPYTPKLLSAGLRGMIGKGGRSEEVCRAIRKYQGIYLCAIGGAGALAARCVRQSQVVAFDDLGCESIKRLEIVNFPLVVAVDCRGGNLLKGYS